MSFWNHTETAGTHRVPPQPWTSKAGMRFCQQQDAKSFHNKIIHLPHFYLHHPPDRTNSFFEKVTVACQIPGSYRAAVKPSGLLYTGKGINLIDTLFRALLSGWDGQGSSWSTRKQSWAARDVLRSRTTAFLLLMLWLLAHSDVSSSSCFHVLFSSFRLWSPLSSSSEALNVFTFLRLLLPRTHRVRPSLLHDITFTWWYSRSHHGCVNCGAGPCAPSMFCCHFEIPNNFLSKGVHSCNQSWKCFKSFMWNLSIHLAILFKFCLFIFGCAGSSLLRVGFSLQSLLLLLSTGSRRAGSVVVAHGLSCPGSRCSLPGPGLNPRSLH